MNTHNSINFATRDLKLLVPSAQRYLKMAIRGKTVTIFEATSLIFFETWKFKNKIIINI